MRYQALVITGLLSVSLLTGAVGMSDPVRNAMAAAEKAYKAGDWESAADHWERAAALSREKAAEHSQHLLPEPLEGWKLADIDSGATLSPVSAAVAPNGNIARATPASAFRCCQTAV